MFDENKLRTNRREHKSKTRLAWPYSTWNIIADGVCPIGQEFGTRVKKTSIE
jgi:hypothetical protein